MTPILTKPKPLFSLLVTIMGLSVRRTHAVRASDLLVGVRLLERGRRDALGVLLVGNGVFGVAWVVMSEDMHGIM